MIPEEIKKQIDDFVENLANENLGYIHPQQRSYIKNYCKQTGEFSYSIAGEELEKYVGIGEALIKASNETEYWKQRCLSAEKILEKYYKRIPDCAEYMDWQQLKQPKSH